MNFHRLQVFRTVAQQGGFSRAAEALLTSQPNISKHVRQLETELGASLFHRLGSGIELTEAGRIVYRYAQQTLDLAAEMEQALAELKGLERGRLRLGAAATPGLYLLPQLAAAFGRRYPNLELSFFIDSGKQVVDEMLAGKIDLGFVGESAGAAGLQAQPFRRDQVVLIAPPDHGLTREPAVTAAALSEETFIMPALGSGLRRATEAALKTLNVRPRRTVEMPGCEAIKRCVAAGLGISFISYLAIELEVSRQTLVVVRGSEITFTRQLYLISRKDARLSPAALTFLAFIRKQDFL